MPSENPSGGDQSQPRLDQDALLNYVRDVMDWNAYQAEAYVTVVRNGPVEPRDIVATTEIPQGRIYDIMGSLEGEAVTVQGRQPKRYKAQHPRSVLGDKQEAFNEKAESAKNHLEQQHEIQRERSDSRHPAWVIPGIGAIARELGDALSEVEDRVLLMERDGDWLTDNELRDFGRLVDAGVTVEVIGWEAWTDTMRELADRGAAVWKADRIDSSIYVIDDSFAAMRTKRGDTGVKIEESGAINVFQLAFEASKEQATEFDPDG